MVEIADDERDEYEMDESDYDEEQEDTGQENDDYVYITPEGYEPDELVDQEPDGYEDGVGNQIMGENQGGKTGFFQKARDKIYEQAGKLKENAPELREKLMTAGKVGAEKLLEVSKAAGKEAIKREKEYRAQRKEQKAAESKNPNAAKEVKFQGGFMGGNRNESSGFGIFGGSGGQGASIFGGSGNGGTGLGSMFSGDNQRESGMVLGNPINISFGGNTPRSINILLRNSAEESQVPSRKRVRRSVKVKPKSKAVKSTKSKDKSGKKLRNGSKRISKNAKKGRVKPTFLKKTSKVARKPKSKSRNRKSKR